MLTMQMAQSSSQYTAPRSAHIAQSETSRSAVEAALLRQYDAAMADAARTLDDFRSAARDYGRALMVEGLRPEEVVIALKHLLYGHGAFKTLPSLYEERDDPGQGPSRYARALEWSLEGYYGDVVPEAVRG